MEETLKNIATDIQKHPIVLYMKGNKSLPMCGFSARVAEVLKNSGVEFETRDVLQNEMLRQAIKEFSNWPTLPQLYINGKFIGGCDIVMQLHETGELKELLNA